MSDLTPTPDQGELLRQARRANLLRIWASGSRRLSAEEQAEIADMTGNTASPTSPSGRGFALDPTAPLPAKLRNYYKFTYADYATGAKGAPHYRNSKDGRTVKRWVSFGRNCETPDLPPLDEPGRMAAWFRRAFPREPVPPVLLDYESHAPPHPQASSAVSPVSPGEPGETAPEAARITSIALDKLQMGEGEQVQQARAIAKANYARVEESSAKGDSDAYRRWFPVWSDSLELLRKLEKEDREARKASGDLIPRGPVLAEIAQLMEALRIMRDGMVAKILAELEKSATGRMRRILRLVKPLLRAAVEKVRGTETDMFRHLESLNSPEAVKQKLAA